MESVEFKQTSNILLNAGIIGLHKYLKKYKENNAIDYDLKIDLQDDKLIVEGKELYKVLEDVYYLMGKDIYDTSGKKAQEKMDKYYFTREPFDKVPFCKMKTYGLGALITNDPQPVPRSKEDAVYFKNIYKDDPDFAERIAGFYREKGLKLKFFNLVNGGIVADDSQKQGDSRVFLNRPYTKTPLLQKFNKKYFQPGKKVCYLTGEAFEKLIDITNVSPFLSGLNNFESFTHGKSRMISWKAMYMSRFSPVPSLYKYTNGLDSLVCYFFNSNSLKNINLYFERTKGFYKSEQQLIDDNYMSNFTLYNPQKKDDAKRKGDSSEYVWEDEILFMIIYTFYKRFLIENELSVEGDDILKLLTSININFNDKPVSLIYFRQDKFASTMRTSHYEVFNNFKFVVQLIVYLEKDGIEIIKLLRSLVFTKRSDSSSKNRYRLERKLRNGVIKGILYGKSVIDKIEWLFYNSFTYFCSRTAMRRRSYKTLLSFLTIYESAIKYGGNTSMSDEIQKRAINLGKSIGQKIINFNNPEKVKDKEHNIKNGRKYIISLQKVRNREQFIDEITRLMTKYHIVISNELMESLSESNWKTIKQFTLISALNQFNAFFLNKDNKEGDK